MIERIGRGEVAALGRNQRERERFWLGFEKIAKVGSENGLHMA